MLGVHEGFVFLEREIIVVVVFARKKLESHPGLCVPAIDVKRYSVFPKRDVPRDCVATFSKQLGQQIAGNCFGEGIVRSGHWDTSGVPGFFVQAE